MSAVEVRTAPSPEADLAPLHKPNKRWTRFILPGFTWLMIVYLTLPVFIMILYSFNDIPVVGSPRQTPKFWGFTLHWWQDLFGIAGLSDALRTSLMIAPLSAFAATALGTLIGLALGRYRFLGKAPINFVIFLAIAVPEIVLGSSLLSMFVLAQAPPIGFTTILLSHIGFSVAFVAVTVRARVQGLDRSLEDAAQDLFANPITTFFKVTLPLIAPAILAGFLLAFVLSLDDFVITNFVSGTVSTFPVWVYGATRIGLPPQVNVMGTLLFSAGLLFAVGNVVVQRRRARS
ncbi:MAG TPA: ABC transporter permease [Actinomycetota bacterium]|nr:ABC transporter permease [Actinomycetota bacterium]